MARFSAKVFCKGERVTARHVSASWWRCACGELLNLLEPSYHYISREEELERLIADQWKDPPWQWTLPLNEDLV